jgi:hypothetical protein
MWSIPGLLSTAANIAAGSKAVAVHHINFLSHMDQPNSNYRLERDG